MKTKKTAIVTGGTSGVGLSLVKGLIEHNFFVTFIGSNASKGTELEKTFNAQTVCTRFFCVDLARLKEVNRFAEEYIKTHNSLDLLANIAGVILPERELTAEGFEKTFSVGYLSSFLLSRKLYPLLKNGKGARIVNVSAHPKRILSPQLDLENLDFSRTYNGFRTSTATVHAKTVMTQFLAKQFAEGKIDVLSFHPGTIRSNLTRHMPFVFRVLGKFFSLFMKVDSENAVYACTSATLTGSSGQLLVNKSLVALNFDESYTASLWRKTTELLSPLNLNTHENS